MQINRILIKSKQAARGTYDAIIIMFDDMHFSMDLMEGIGGDRDIRRVIALGKEIGVDVDCYEPRLQERIRRL